MGLLGGINKWTCSPAVLLLSGGFSLVLSPQLHTLNEPDRVFRGPAVVGMATLLCFDRRNLRGLPPLSSTERSLHFPRRFCRPNASGPHSAKPQAIWRCASPGDKKKIYISAKKYQGETEERVSQQQLCWKQLIKSLINC